MDKRYRAEIFGLRVASAFDLCIPGQELSFDGGAVHDVDILRGDEAPKPAGPYLRMRDGRENDLALRFTEGTICRMSGGRLIEVWESEKCSEAVLATYLVGRCFGNLLYQRGMIPFHAAAVSKNGQAILLMGESGVGKSTICDSFLRQGWQLLSDDLCCVGTDGEHLRILPGCPFSRVWMEKDKGPLTKDRWTVMGGVGSVRYLYEEGAKEKWLLDRRECFADGPAEPKAVFLLTDRPGPLQIERIEPFFATKLLQENTYTPCIRPVETRKAIFLHCTRIAGQVPVYRVYRDKREISAENVIDRILEIFGESG